MHDRTQGPPRPGIFDWLRFHLRPLTLASLLATGLGSAAVAPAAKLADPGTLPGVFIGGSWEGDYSGLAVAPNGDVILVGDTYDATLPVTDASTNNNGDIYVARFDPKMREIKWLVYLGGSDYDIANKVAVDSSGNVYVVGGGSYDFPVTPGAYDDEAEYGAGVIFKLAAATGEIEWATFFEGMGEVLDFTVDVSGRPILVGGLGASGLPLVNELEGYTSRSDAFICRFSADGEELEFSTYYGAGKDEEARAVATDGFNNIFVLVHGRDYETAYETNEILKISGSSLLLSWTHLVDALPPEGGGSFLVEDIAATTYGDVVFAGYIEGTYGEPSPSIDPVLSPLGGGADFFVGRLDDGGSTVHWLTYIGGTGSETSATLALADDNRIYVGGYSTSADYPLRNGIFASGQSVVTLIDGDGDDILWSTAFGGHGANLRDLATDGEVAVAGGDATIPQQLLAASILPFQEGTVAFAVRLEPLSTGRFLPRRSLNLPPLDRLVEPLPGEGLDIDGDGVLEIVVDLPDRSLDPAFGSIVLDRYGDGRDLLGVGIGSLDGAKVLGILDQDHDGEPELVVEDARRDIGTVEGWLLDTGDLDVDLLVVGSGGWAGGFLVDLDDDGEPEIVVGAPHLSAGAVARVNLDYPFDSDFDVLFVGGILRAALDIDDDGELEVVAERTGTAGTISYGTLEFTPDGDEDVLFLVGAYAFARDFDDDRIPEIVAVNSAATDGTATYVAPVIFVGGEPLVAADFDDDDELELVAYDDSALDGTLDGIDLLDGSDEDVDLIFVGGAFRGAFDLDGDQEPELVVEAGTVDPDTLDATDVDADEDTDLLAVGGEVVAAVDLDDDGEWEIVAESGLQLDGAFLPFPGAEEDADYDPDVIFVGGTVAGFADLDGDWELELIAEDDMAASGTYDQLANLEADGFDFDRDVIFVAGEWRATRDLDEDGEPEVVSEDSGLGSAATTEGDIELTADSDPDVIFVKAPFLTLHDLDLDGEPEILVEDNGVSAPDVDFTDFLELGTDLDTDLVAVPENAGWLIADIDGDGEDELVLEHDGGTAGVTTVVDGVEHGGDLDGDVLFVGGIPQVVANLDLDGDSEVVVEAAITPGTASVYRLIEGLGDPDADVVYVGGTARGHADLDGDGEEEVVAESGSVGTSSHLDEVDEAMDADPDVVFVGGVLALFADIDIDGEMEAIVESSAASPGTSTRENQIDGTPDSDADVIFVSGRVIGQGDFDFFEENDIAINDPDLAGGTALEANWDGYGYYDGVFAGTDSSAGSPSLTLLSPDGGGTVDLTDPLGITWLHSGFAGPVRIELSRDNGTTWEVLFTSTANDGSETWTAEGDPTTDALIRIISRNLADPVSDVSSSTFTIN